jgi:16S rRNA (cytosine1402-N4)-methyltransferase
LIFNSSNTFTPVEPKMIIPIKPWLELANGNAGLGAFQRQLPVANGLILSSNWERGLGLGEIRGWNSGLAENIERMDFYHEPILAEEILEAMRPVEGKQIFDGTLGGGGHSELLLRNRAHVIGCDQDQEALDHATRRLDSYGDSFLPVRGNFRDIDVILAGLGIPQVDGILLDLGVSSRQLDDPARGFSFREDGPLDMRMDVRASFSARDLVNTWGEEELIRIFREYGEERHAARVAREIVKVRATGEIATTLGLADLVARVVPKTSGKHPATRVFQAIRIAVNGELEALEAALEKSVQVLAPGGVLAILTFHSLEDRIVKRFMHRRSSPYIDRPEWSEPRRNPDFAFHLPTRKAIGPDEAETKRNTRSRSAKLRVAVKA